VTLSDGSIRNTYDLRLRNMSHEDRVFTVSLTSDAALALAIEGTDTTTVPVAPDSTQTLRLYVTAEPGSAAARSERTDLTLWIEDPETRERIHAGTIFNGNAN
jgi:hypothetical protein